MFKFIGASFSLLGTLALLMPTAAYAQKDRVSFDGYGPARIGMSRHTLEQALGSKLTKDNVTEDPTICEFVAPVDGYTGVDYMLINGKLARIDISSRTIKTVSGAKIGASKTAVMALYPGRIVVTPHAYTAPGGSYLTLLSPTKARGIRFETDTGKIIGYYAGTAEAIQYIEGCQ